MLIRAARPHHDLGRRPDRWRPLSFIRTAVRTDAWGERSRPPGRYRTGRAAESGGIQTGEADSIGASRILRVIGAGAAGAASLVVTSRLATERPASLALLALVVVAAVTVRPPLRRHAQA